MGEYAPAGPVRSPEQLRQDNTLGLLAMVLGAVSLVTGGLLLGIPAIVLGAKGRHKADHGLATNRDQATVGFVCGIISTALSGVVLLVVLPLLLALVPLGLHHATTTTVSATARTAYRANTASSFDVQQQAMRFLGDTGRSIASLQCQPLPDLNPGSATSCDGVLVGGLPVSLQVQVVAPDGELNFLG